MDIKAQLQVELSKQNAIYIAKHISNDPKLFSELMSVVFDNKQSLSMRASWVVTIVCESYPELLEPYLEKTINFLPISNHSGTRRCLLRTLSEMELPEDLWGILYDFCYNCLVSTTEPPAVKVHSMQILYNIGKKEPELLKELELILEELIHDESGAIQSRSRELLKKLNKR